MSPNASESVPPGREVGSEPDIGTPEELIETIDELLSHLDPEYLALALQTVAAVAGWQYPPTASGEQSEDPQ